MLNDFISMCEDLLTFIMAAALLCVNLFTVSALVLTVFRVLFVMWVITMLISFILS